MPKLTKPLLSPILDNDLLTRGLGDPEARMLVEWSTTESFKTVEHTGFVDALPETDFTANVLIDHLPAGQDIFYRIRFEDFASPTIMSEPHGSGERIM